MLGITGKLLIQVVTVKKNSSILIVFSNHAVYMGLPPLVCWNCEFHLAGGMAVCWLCVVR